jgi:hypothetical protein
LSGARAIFDDDLLLGSLDEFLREQPHGQIGDAPGSVRNENVNWLCREARFGANQARHGSSQNEDAGRAQARRRRSLRRRLCERIGTSSLVFFITGATPR